jgi:CHAD domain-containing protein
MIDKSCQLLACKYLHDQLDKLQKTLTEAQSDDDIEGIHQSRVACRRIRASLNFFDNCFVDKKVKSWQKQIRKLTKKLGSARDADVHTEFIKKFLSGLDEKQKQYRPGIKRLLLRLRQKREQVQPKVVKTVEAFNSSGVLADMHGEIEKILYSCGQKGEDFQSFFVFRHAEQQIRKQLDEMLSRSGSLADSEDKKGHHWMRIAAKRLRYTLEICDIPFDGELKEITSTVKKIQTCLGDIHDCDVWQEVLEKFAAKEKERTEHYYGHSRSFSRIERGLQYLSQDCARRRRKLFREFVKYWRRIDEERTWEKLQSIIDSHLQLYNECSQNDALVTQGRLDDNSGHK